MKLSDLIETKNFFTEKLSDVNRNLSFAGIAIIWIFKYWEIGQFKLPEGLILPAILFILSLFLDLLQFTYGSIIWTIVYRHKEKKVTKDEDFGVSRIHSNIMFYIAFIPKVFFNIVGYVFILIYLFPLLN